MQNILFVRFVPYVLYVAPFVALTMTGWPDRLGRRWSRN